MPSTKAARFTIRDVMIWTAATGVAFGLVRIVWASIEAHIGAAITPNDRFERAYRATSILMFCWTIALFISWTLADRRPLVRKLSSPGYVVPFTLIVATLWMASMIGPGFLKMMTHSGSLLQPTPIRYVIASLTSPIQASPLIVSAWAIQRASGRWRAEPSWLDRTGRVIGVGWIVLPLSQILSSELLF